MYISTISIEMFGNIKIKIKMSIFFELPIQTLKLFSIEILQMGKMTYMQGYSWEHFVTGLETT